MDRLIRILGICNKYICALFIAVMVMLVFVNTVMRYVFSTNIIMGEELVRYFFVWATFLAVISVYYEHRHIAVTTVTERLSPKAGNTFGFIMNFLAVYALWILLKGSVMYFEETTTMGQATHIPYKVMVIPVCISAACCLCIVLADMYKQIRVMRGGAK